MPIDTKRYATILCLVLVGACQPDAADGDVALAAAAADEATAAGGEPALESLVSRYSYAIGAQLAQNMHSQGVEIDVDSFALAMRDVLADRELRMAEPARRQAIEELSSQQRDREAARLAGEIERGAQYREHNKGQTGVVQMDSGLQYRLLSEGSGDKPGACDRVTVHYTGSLIDGTEFDSSVGRGQPATFALDGVIPGWTEGLQQIRKGAKAEFVIPPDLGYGDRGNARIPGGSTLVFEVELLDIESHPCG